MSRETKKERIERNMEDQVTEHLIRLKNIAATPTTKESDIERWCESVLTNCLGFTATNDYQVRAQESKGKSRPDLIILHKDKPVCVVEVKKLGFDLDKSEFRSGKLQLSEYLSLIGSVQWGILTNGYEWKIFDFSDQKLNGVEAYSLDLRSDTDELDTTKRGIEDACFALADIHETALHDGTWEKLAKESMAFSFDSLAKAILDINSVKYVAKVIKGEHDHKANIEVLYDKLTDLIIKGLNDSNEWNETKQLELSKYVNNQKKSNRKKKVVKEKPAVVAVIDNTKNASDVKKPDSGENSSGSTPIAA